MQERKVILTWEAIYDITDIADYIEAYFGVERANRFQQDIQKQMLSLETVGGVFGRTHIKYRSYAIYKKPFPPSIIFYIVKDPEKEVHILRVLREERDWETILLKDQEYTYP